LSVTFSLPKGSLNGPGASPSFVVPRKTCAFSGVVCKVTRTSFGSTAVGVGTTALVAAGGVDAVVAGADAAAGGGEGGADARIAKKTPTAPSATTPIAMPAIIPPMPFLFAASGCDGTTVDSD